MAHSQTPESKIDDVHQVERLDRLATLMDSAIGIPGTKLRVGLDSIIGLVPGAGDALTLLPAAYIIGSAWQLGAPRRTLGRMAANLAIDTAVGSIPLLGDIFDVGFKANRRNVALLRQHLEKKKEPPLGSSPGHSRA